MTDIPQKIDPEELLLHRASLKTIAMILLREENQAEDILQETYLTALKNPPRELSSLQSWLAVITRNFARKKIREEVRRKTREEAVAKPVVVRAASDIVEQENTRRYIVDAVLSLKEPTRSTLLFRFFDDLSPREIARIYDIPEKTVNSRIRRGLLKLKAKLKAEYGGDSKAYCLALAPLAGIQLSEYAVAASSSMPALTMKTAVAGWALKLCFILALVAGSSLIIHLFLDDEKSEAPAGTLFSASSEPAIAGHADSDSDVAARSGSEERTPLEPEGFTLAGTVFDRTTGKPIEAYDICLIDSAKRTPFNETIIHETVRNENGRFSYHLEDESVYHIMIRSSKYRMHIAGPIDSSREGNAHEVNIALDPGVTLRGRVVRDDTGEPIEGVLVGTEATSICYNTHGTIFGDALKRGYPEFDLHTHTDDSGSFVLSGIDDLPQHIGAFFPGFAQAWATYVPKDNHRDLELRLKRGARIACRVVDQEGQPVEGISMDMWGPSFPFTRRYETDCEGRFISEPALPGEIHIWPACVMEKTGCMNEASTAATFSHTARRIMLEDRDEEVVFVLSPLDSFQWCGTVFDNDGKPVDGGQLILEPSPELLLTQCENSSKVLIPHFCRIDNEGNFRMENLLPGRYLLKIVLGKQDDRRPDRKKPEAPSMVEWGIISFDAGAPNPFRRDLHIPGGSICGVLLDADGAPLRSSFGTVCAMLVEGDHRSHYSAMVDGNGRFRLYGLHPGTYNLWAGIDRMNTVGVRLDRLTIRKNQSIDDLRLTVPASGRVIVILDDDSSQDINNTQFTFKTCGHGICLQGCELSQLYNDRTRSFDIPLKEGNWSIRISYKTRMGMGLVDRTFRITAGQTAELFITEKELLSRCGSVTCSGRIQDRKGSPHSGFDVEFVPLEMTVIIENFDLLSASDSSNHPWKAVCDDDGYYEIDGLAPGMWDVKVSKPDGSSITFFEQRVRPAQEGKTHLIHELPEYKVSGELLNRLGGPLLNEFSAKARVTLLKRLDETSTDPFLDFIPESYFLGLENSLYPYSEHTGLKSNRFIIEHIPEGEYRLVVNVPGYIEYTRDFEVRACDKVMELGQIFIEPCGLLDLEVRLDDDTPLESFHLHYNGNEYCSAIEQSNMVMVDEHRYCCDKLPLGPILLKVSKTGYAPGEVMVFLKPNEIAKASVVLKQE